MGLQFVVSVVGLGDPLLEGHVGVVPVAPHLISTVCYQAINFGHESLGGGSGGCKSVMQVGYGLY